MRALILVMALAVSACTTAPVIPSLTPTKTLQVDPWAMDEGPGYPALEDRAYSETEVMDFIGRGAIAYSTLLSKYRILKNVITNLQKESP